MPLPDWAVGRRCALPSAGQTGRPGTSPKPSGYAPTGLGCREDVRFGTTLQPGCQGEDFGARKMARLLPRGQRPGLRGANERLRQQANV